MKSEVFPRRDLFQPSEHSEIQTAVLQTAKTVEEMSGAVTAVAVLADGGHGGGGKKL
jgi:hypothetical protein